MKPPCVPKILSLSDIDDSFIVTSMHSAAWKFVNGKKKEFSERETSKLCNDEEFGASIKKSLREGSTCGDKDVERLLHILELMR